MRFSIAFHLLIFGRNRRCDASGKFDAKTAIFPLCFEHSYGVSGYIIYNHRIFGLCTLWWFRWSNNHRQPTERWTVCDWFISIFNKAPGTDFPFTNFHHLVLLSWLKFWLESPLYSHLDSNFTYQWTFFGAKSPQEFQKTSITWHRFWSVEERLPSLAQLLRPFQNWMHSLDWLEQFFSQV